jgi:hypothetical protein
MKCRQRLTWSNHEPRTPGAMRTENRQEDLPGASRESWPITLDLRSQNCDRLNVLGSRLWCPWQVQNARYSPPSC